MNSSPDLSLPYETARHSDVQQTFARVQSQRLEESRTGQCLGVLGGTIAVLFREQALKTTSSSTLKTTLSSETAPAAAAARGQSPREPFHHG
jgi:hypothetical protein